MAGPRTAEGRQDWRTPPWLVELLAREFGAFEQDAAASRENRVAPLYIDEKRDARTAALHDQRVFCNPPYKRGEGGLRPWIDAFARWSDAGCLVVAVLPNSTDTAWFGALSSPQHAATSGAVYDGMDLVDVVRDQSASECRFVLPRIAFLDPEGKPQKGNMGGTMIGVWQPRGGLRKRACHLWSWDLRDYIETLRADPATSWQFSS